MFTGLIKYTGIVLHIEKCDNNPTLLAIYINDIEIVKDLEIGESISVNGVCLTIIRIVGAMLYFHSMDHTMSITNLSFLTINDVVNIELARNSLQNNKLDGHIVLGHVDCRVKICDIKKMKDNSIRLTLNIYNNTILKKKWIVPKGSVALNGISLTVAELYNNEFIVFLLPYTYNNTNLKYVSIGDELNIEFDCQLKSQPISKNYDYFKTMIGQRIPSHNYAMDLAIELGNLGRVTAPPNPWVGCVIVKNSILIGIGYHDGIDKRHAEHKAIDFAIAHNYNVVNADLYVTLEPCSHYGKTPPCCMLLKNYHLKNIYVALEDPDTKVCGRGIEYLRNRHISVCQNVLYNKAHDSLKEYIFQRKNLIPYIVLKVATSIDGKIASRDYSSKWITDNISRHDVQILRSKSQAIMVGTNTCIYDNPRLNVRMTDFKGKQPYKIILDKHGKINSTKYNVISQPGKTLIFTSSLCEKTTLQLWNKLKIKYFIVDIINNQLDLYSICKKLSNLGVIQLLVEGGGKLITSFIQQGLFNEIIQYQGPKIIGRNGINFFDISIGNNMEDTMDLELISSDIIGNCIKTVYGKTCFTKWN